MRRRSSLGLPLAVEGRETGRDAFMTMKTSVCYWRVNRRPTVRCLLPLLILSVCLIVGFCQIPNFLPETVVSVSAPAAAVSGQGHHVDSGEILSEAVLAGETNETIENQLLRLDALGYKGHGVVNFLVEKSIPSGATEKLLISDLFKGIQVECVQEFRSLIYDQAASRRKREETFMEACGWGGMSDLDWNQILESESYTVGDVYKAGEAAGTASISMQMKYANASYKVWFKVAPNSAQGERHLAQIAVFLLDRILGLYYAVPAKGIVIDVDDITRAARESNSIRRFLKRIKTKGDYYIQGSISAWVVEKLHKAKIILPSRRDESRDFTRQQKEDMEYILLMWLSGLSITPHNIQKVKGRPTAFDTDRAFRSTASGFWSHVYLCHFPKHVIEVLRFAKSHDGCRLSDLLLYALKQDPLRPNRYDFGTNTGFVRDSFSMMDEFTDRLLDVVDECILKYGELDVIYRD